MARLRTHNRRRARRLFAAPKDHRFGPGRFCQRCGMTAEEAFDGWNRCRYGREWYDWRWQNIHGRDHKLESFTNLIGRLQRSKSVLGAILGVDNFATGGFVGFPDIPPLLRLRPEPSIIPRLRAQAFGLDVERDGKPTAVGAMLAIDPAVPGSDRTAIVSIDMHSRRIMVSDDDLERAEAISERVRAVLADRLAKVAADFIVFSGPGAAALRSFHATGYSMGVRQTYAPPVEALPEPVCERCEGNGFVEVYSPRPPAFDTCPVCHNPEGHPFP
jgi:hypothetical protein